MLSITLTIILAGLICVLIKSQYETKRLKVSLRKYDSLVSKDNFEEMLDSNISLKQKELNEMENEKELLYKKIQKLQNQLEEIDARVYLESLDSYDFQYDFSHSEEYLIELKKIKAEQERMKKNNQAFICQTEWTMDNNKNKGKKMINNFLTIIKIAFETQCDSAIKEVKYNNIFSLEKKINGVFEKLNKLSSVTYCKITKSYLDLKLKELHLKHELEEKKQEEKEKAKLINEQLKKQQKERQALEKSLEEIEEAAQREKQYQEDIEKLTKDMERMVGLQQEEYQRKIDHLSEQLLKAQNDKEKAVSSSKKIKSGYIYVVSNIGSFGKKHTYKIFMTKGFPPEQYIKNINPAVPFPFDVHFKVHSEDASETLNELHQRFDNRRINIVNERRDFFEVTWEEIEQALKEISKETGILRIEQSERVPHAYEYHRSKSAQEKKNQHLNSTHADSAEERQTS